MRNVKSPRFYAILLVFIVSALSIAGILGERLALPLILFSLSLLLFTMAYEMVVLQRALPAKRLLTLGLFLFILSLALGLYAFIE
ncbi:MAG: hypothetical protein ACLFUQ_01200 [Candidatus Izemoplasmataceae bacterium]